MGSALDKIKKYQDEKTNNVKNYLSKTINGYDTSNPLDKIQEYYDTKKATNVTSTTDKTYNTSYVTPVVNAPEVMSTPVTINNSKNRDRSIQTNYDTSILKKPTREELEKTKNEFQEWREQNKDKIVQDNRTFGEKLKDEAEFLIKTPLNMAIEAGKGVVDFAEGVGDLMLQFGSSKANPYYWFNPDKLEEHQKIASELIKEDSSQKFIDDTLGYNKQLSNGKTVQETLNENSLVRSDNTLGKVFRSTGTQLPSLILGGGAASTVAFATNVYGNALGDAYAKGASRGTASVYALTETAIELLTEKIYGGVGSTLGTGALDDFVEKKIAEKFGETLTSKLIQLGAGAIFEGGEEVASDALNQMVKWISGLSDGELQKLIDDPDYLDSFVSGALGSILIGGMQIATNNNVSDMRRVDMSNNTNEVALPTYNGNANNNSNKETPTTINENENKIAPESTEKYEYLPTNNQKINNFMESVSKYFDNSQETADMVNTISKVISDKDYNVTFDDSIVNKNGNPVNAQISNNDGQIEIKINPNSERATEFLLVHEITHAIETDSMKQLVLDYASKHADFNQALNDLKTTYGVEDVNDEVLADISGQLFGNQEFINDLSMKEPNLFVRIYNKIVEIANKITGNSKEALFIRDLKNKWEAAYRNTSTSEAINNLGGNLKYMMTSNLGVQNGINANSRYQDIKNRYEMALKMLNNGYSNEAIRQATGWFRDKYGNWEFEISDHNVKFKTKPEANKTYKLEELLNASTLYEMYPELKDIKVVFKDLGKKSGSYRASTNTIYANNKLVNTLDSLKGTLLHEIQHYIQKYEGLPTGTTILFGNEQYANSKGEIEAADIKNRRNMSVEERKQIAPQSSMENPIHPNRENILNHKRNFIEKIGEKIYNKLGDKSDEIFEENYNQNQEENIANDSRYSGDGLRTDDSSFSMDSQGRTLSKEQQEYFKDSKARDENGNLEVVYHTMTNEGKQFNEFNPVGTDYYKFGDQIVNYFTDDKDMSGSYADQDYIMADTKKMTSMKEVEDYIKERNKTGWGSEKTYKLIQEGDRYKLIDNSKIPNTDKTWQQIYDEANEYKKTLTEEEYKQFKDMFDKSSNFNSNGRYNIDSYLINNNYEFGSEEDRIAQKYLNIDSKNVYERGIYFDALFRNARYHTIAEFNNEQDMFKNLKSETQPLARRQYEGYVNITKPYIIDAEGRYWNKIESKKDSVATSKLLALDTLTKDRLSQLAKDSKKRYEETYKEYQKWNDAKNSVSGSLRDENPLTVRLANRFIEESTLPLVKEFVSNNYRATLDTFVEDYQSLQEKDSLEKTHEWRVNTDVMYNLYNNDFIPYSMYNEFNNTLVVPEEAREKAKEIINQIATYNEYDSEGHNPIKKQSKLVDIWENYVDSYKMYENNGRYDYSLFDNQLLDGYLKEELENLFPIKEPGIGTNYDYLKQLYKSASHNFDENYIRLEFNDWSVTNDIVKSIIELNKVGENYDGVIIKNTVDYGGDSEAHDPHNLYITFNSNQFKALDNTTPTEDADIRYSEDSSSWQEYVEKNYKSSGTKTDMPRIRMSLPRAIPQNPTKESTYDKGAYDRKKQHEKLIKQDVKKKVKSESQKALNVAVKIGQKYLWLDKTQRTELKSQLSKYLGKSQKQLTNAKTWNEVKNIVNQYAEKQIVNTDEELKSVKNIIRNTNIKVDDNLKAQITDYSDFRKENFGKLKLTKDGASVDSIYQELSEQYPYYFNDATTQADMLYELSDFMNKNVDSAEHIKLDDATLNRATTKIYNSLLQNTMNEDAIKELKEEIAKKYSKRTREIIRKELLDDMGITEKDIASGKDIASIDFARTDPIRVNEKVFGSKVGQKINDATINKTKHNEAERTRWLNKERGEIKTLGIKAHSKESEAVQKYGEKQYITRNNEVKPYGDAELAKDFPNVETQNKIKKAAQVIREKYDSYIDQINDVLTDMGYTPIKKRNDYMRHFQALNDVFSRFGTPLNAQSMQNDALPTDINGLTDQFKPGKQYFANAMQRMGLKTEYDAITGIDGYLDGASNLIYHTEDIQRYRALSNLIRDTYGSKNGFEDFASMTEQEQEQRLADIQSNKLSKYAAWLDEQANALAGKKGKIDRGAEELFGRKVYNVLQTAKKQVGSNMTGYNVRSAMTNFASAIQGASKTNKMAFIKGTISTINNIIHKDGLIDKSDFLTSRFGSDSLSTKLWQKISSAGQVFMQGTDYFTANQIWRSKYFENLSKGMGEAQAIKNADDFAARIMGDRSKGSTATIFNSNTLGFLTQFQLEVNNQWSSMIHDNKMDIQRGNKTGKAVVFQLGQLFAMSYLFNNMMKSLTGSDVMIDPIDLLKKIFNPDDDDDKTIEERATEVLSDVINDVPFASIFTGGRIPLSEAFNGVTTGAKYLTGQTDKYGNKYSLSDVKDDMIESAYYWLLPTGYGQLRKTVKGASMYNSELPVAGSYTNSGNLRFTADESASGKAKALLFGQYSSKEAQDYVDSGYKTISKNSIQEMKDLEMTSSEYRKLKSDISNASQVKDKNGYVMYSDDEGNTYWYDKANKTLYDNDYKESNIDVTKLTKSSQTEKKLNYINSLDNLNNKQKNILANNVVSSNSTVDKYGNQKYILTKYDEKGKAKEYTYWYDEKNNKLYDGYYNVVDVGKLNSMKKATPKTINMEEYNNYDSYDEMKYATQNPTNYSLIKSITTYDEYLEHKNQINQIKEKYSGTKSTSTRKKAVFNYIESLPYSKAQKIILYNTLGGYEINDYKKIVFNYIENQKISKKEKEEMWQLIYGK